MTRGTTTRNLLVAGACSIVFMMSGACAESGKDEQKDEPRFTEAERPESMTREERIAMRQELQDLRNIETVPGDDLRQDEVAVTGEVPEDLLDKIYVDLEQNVGADRSAFTLVRGEAVQWSDGSLGCPEPGQMYTQAVVGGFHVVIEYAGKQYDYRSSERGYFVLCSDPLMQKIQEKEKGPRSGAPIQ